MNLEKLFNIQKQLDKRIVKEHGLEGQDLLDKKILALQVELGELANEWRGFKFWSEDQEPRFKQWNECPKCEGEGWIRQEYVCAECEGGFTLSYPLLEEYVDCLHFILSIGLEIDLTPVECFKWKRFTIVEQFNDLFGYTSDLFKSIEQDWSEEEKYETYEELLCGFIGLGDQLGFTEEQIEQAYLDKNNTNHERQDNGY